MNLERLFLRIVVTLLPFYGLMSLGILICYMVEVEPVSLSLFIFPLAFVLAVVVEKKYLDKNLRMGIKDWIYCSLFFLFVVVVGMIASNSY
ncbi:hypothetical protein [Phocaeicola sp.]